MAEGPMPCPADQMPSLRELANRVFRADGGDMFREYPTVFDTACPENMRVIVEDGRVVSHVGVCVRDAAILGATVRTASIGAVSTLPEYRGRGYASLLMQDAIDRSRERGAQLMLISGTRGLYRRLGAISSGSFQRYEVNWPLVTVSLSVRRAEESDIETLVRLYQREPVRFFRSPEDWRTLLRAEMLMNQPADCWLVLDQGEPVAYLAAQREGWQGQPSVQEYAGSRQAVWGALGLVGQEYGASAVDLRLMPEDAEMALRARLAGLGPRPVGFPGTVLVLDAGALLERLAPVWMERVGEERYRALKLRADRDTLSFQAEGERRVLRGSEITAALFGPEPGQETEGYAPLGLPPLPMLWYGYNYV